LSESSDFFHQSPFFSSFLTGPGVGVDLTSSISNFLGASSSTSPPLVTLKVSFSPSLDVCGASSSSDSS